MYLWSTLILYIQVLNTICLAAILLAGGGWVLRGFTQQQSRFLLPLLLVGFGLLELGYGIFFYQITTPPPFFKPLPIESSALALCGALGVICLWSGRGIEYNHRAVWISAAWVGAGMVIANRMAMLLECSSC